jgi:hypothetical protein
MAIREQQPAEPTVGFHRTKFGSRDAEQADADQRKKDKESQKVVSCVSRGCSVTTVRDTTLREFEEVTAADVGGDGNLERLGRVGAVSIISEREAKTNRGEFELRFKKSVCLPPKVWDVGEGFNAEELDKPAVEPVQRVDVQGRVVMSGGRPAVVGTEKAEDLIRRDLVERTKLRDKVTAAVKKRLKRDAEAESGA